MINNAFKTMQLAANDLKPGTQLSSQCRGQATQILFEQLDVNVQRTERIADFMGQPSQEAFEQVAFFGDCQLARVLSQSFCEDAFH